MTDEVEDPFSCESDLLKHISQLCLEHGIETDFTDDCAYLAPSAQIISTDAVVENIHFDSSWFDPFEIGRQAAVVNLSDIAGSGAYPTWALWSLQIPSHWLDRKFSQLCKGFISELARFNTRLVGGNLCVGGDILAIHVTVGGTPFRADPVTRAGATPGDHIYVSGTLGNSAPALRTLRPKHINLRTRWHAHVEESRRISTLDGLSAMMDISDGLVIDAQRLAKASNVALKLDAACIPCVSPKYSDRPLQDALYGGEDYILLFTCAPGSKIPDFAKKIGEVLPGAGVFLDEIKLPDGGFDHLRNARQNEAI